MSDSPFDNHAAKKGLGATLSLVVGRSFDRLGSSHRAFSKQQAIQFSLPLKHTLTLHPLLTTMTIAQTCQNLNPSWPQARRASIYHFGTEVFKPAADVSYMSHVVLSASLK